MKRTSFSLIILVLGILLYTVIGGIWLERGQAFELSSQDSSLSKVESEFEEYSSRRKDYLLDTANLISPEIKMSKNIKGIYISASTLNSSYKINQLLKLVKQTTLNAVVIDIKDIKGEVTFDNKGVGYERFRRIVTDFKKHGVYVIGRLAVFKDYKLAKQSQYSLKYSLVSNSEVTIDSSKWANPYSKEIWEYNVKIAQQAVNLGVDEIQFDYVRYPALGPDSKLAIKLPDKGSKTDAIVNFLKYARNQLKQEDVLISADVFGLTTTIDGDLGIGQNIIRMVKYIDYLSPMIYPSHYNQGIYGIKDPEKQPYEIIARSLADAKEKLGPASYKLRPWLQDFSLKHIYNKKEIKAQIKAVTDKQLTGWLLWNPASNYTIEALINKINEG